MTDEERLAKRAARCREARAHIAAERVAAAPAAPAAAADNDDGSESEEEEEEEEQEWSTDQLDSYMTEYNDEHCELAKPVSLPRFHRMTQN